MCVKGTPPGRHSSPNRANPPAAPWRRFYTHLTLFLLTIMRGGRDYRGSLLFAPMNFGLGEFIDWLGENDGEESNSINFFLLTRESRL